ncbi:MAG: hypothetical protein [Caudoviricetes sp.]|nr:MAG: hypothetical protein [Caudoviricetes sp.]
MNKDNARDYLPLVQALAEGRVIQKKNGDGGWTDISSLATYVAPSDYRIKPEPREIFVPRWPDGFEGAPYRTEREAKQILANETTCKIIRYREVIE